MLTFGHLMVKTYKPVIWPNTRLYLKYSLVFFLVLFFAGCSNQASKITLVYKNGRATGIQIPVKLLDGASVAEAIQSVKVVRLGSGAGQHGILGNFTNDRGALVFSPLIPLTPGMGYVVFVGDKKLGSIMIPADNSALPKLVAIYPATDTLPENTLKLYLQFSQPMRTGQALNYVCLLDKNKDTMRNVFLNLQPELWDTSGTVLTLWLDPGRIKRGLVLNKELGNPLKKAERYQLIVSGAWKDTHGNKLGQQFTKKFLAVGRDEKMPDVDSWKIQVPKAESTDPLIINTGEPLDHYLLQECIVVNDAVGNAVAGKAEVSSNDHLWAFTPAQPWTAKRYTLQVRATLEDLAGNNLNRIFDRDITKDKTTNKAFVERGFVVK